MVKFGFILSGGGGGGGGGGALRIWGGMAKLLFGAVMVSNT